MRDRNDYHYQLFDLAVVTGIKFIVGVYLFLYLCCLLIRVHAAIEHRHADLLLVSSRLSSSILNYRLFRWRLDD